MELPPSVTATFPLSPENLDLFHDIFSPWLRLGSIVNKHTFSMQQIVHAKNKLTPYQESKKSISLTHLGLLLHKHFPKHSN